MDQLFSNDTKNNQQRFLGEEKMKGVIINVSTIKKSTI